MPPPERIDACLRRTYDDGSFGGNHVLGLRMSLRSVERSAHNEAYVQQRISVAHNSGWIAGLRLLLFSTGNPSVTYSILGGWYWVTLLVAQTVFAYCVYEFLIGRVNKRLYVFHLLFLLTLCLALFVVAGPNATRFASIRQQAKVDSFIQDPINYKADVSSGDRQLMVEIKRQKYTVQSTDFIPQFRMTYNLFRTEQGALYRLVLDMPWNGLPEIYLYRVSHP